MAKRNRRILKTKAKSRRKSSSRRRGSVIEYAADPYVAEAIAKVVTGAIPFNSSHYYLNDVNGDGRVTVSDAYYISAKKQGRFTTWIGTFTSRLFTPTEYTTIKSNTSNLKPTYPGVSSITVASPTNGGSSSYYIVAPGYSTNTTF